MGEDSNIPWCDHTWNPWQGCTKVSPGCDLCYMHREKLRYGQDPIVVVRSKPATFNAPLKWKEPARVFVCSWSDFFHRDADGWRDEAWAEIRNAPHLTWIILTKRPELMADRLPSDWGTGWSNVWLGVTAENQEMADKRMQYLLNTEAFVRFVSVEPLLEEIDLGQYLMLRRVGNLDWVIVGGETGNGARPMHPDWVRRLKDQCEVAEVPFFFKGWGEWTPEDKGDAIKGRVIVSLDGSMHSIKARYLAPSGGVEMFRIGKGWSGDFLDGKQYHEFPDKKFWSPARAYDKCGFSHSMTWETGAEKVKIRRQKIRKGRKAV